MKIAVSIIIPTREINNHRLKEIIPALKKQTFKNFELIVVPDRSAKKAKIPSMVKVFPSGLKSGPAEKRDLGVRQAKGEIIAFTDDDAYPEKNWLKNAIHYFKNPEIAAVCGPGITPPDNNLRQKVSGWLWKSWLGAGGAGTYRCRPEKKREVDDYPTFNLIIRKKDFNSVGGFKTHFWPGEDTNLCHRLVYQKGKKIIYDPRILVFHHRREVFLPHLRQISAYGLHRGHFARILPKTSLRVGYLIPALFVLGLIVGFFLSLVNPRLRTVYVAVLGIYLCLLILTSLKAFIREKNLKLALFLALAIFLTHIVYGSLFIRGFLSPKLKR